MKLFDARLVCQRLCLLTNKGQAAKDGSFLLLLKKCSGMEKMDSVTEKE